MTTNQNPIEETTQCDKFTATEKQCSRRTSFMGPTTSKAQSADMRTISITCFFLQTLQHCLYFCFLGGFFQFVYF